MRENRRCHDSLLVSRGTQATAVPPSEGGSQPALLVQNESEKIKGRAHVPQALQFSSLCLACSITNVTSKEQPGWLVRSASPYQPYIFTLSATLAPILSPHPSSSDPSVLLVAFGSKAHGPWLQGIFFWLKVREKSSLLVLCTSQDLSRLCFITHG